MSNESCAIGSTPTPAPRADPLHVPMLPDLERAEMIGEFWNYPKPHLR